MLLQVFLSINTVSTWFLRAHSELHPETTLSIMYRKYDRISLLDHDGMWLLRRLPLEWCALCTRTTDTSRAHVTYIRHLAIMIILYYNIIIVIDLRAGACALTLTFRQSSTVCSCWPHAISLVRLVWLGWVLTTCLRARSTKSSKYPTCLPCRGMCVIKGMRGDSDQQELTTA